MDLYNKHFIRLDIDKNIICGFSDAFEQPQAGDICITEQGNRHFELFGHVNPDVKDANGICIYKYVDSQVVAKTTIEIQDETESISKSKPQPTEIDLLQLALVEQYEENLKLKESLTTIELALVELYERSI